MTGCPPHLRPILTSPAKLDAAIAQAKARTLQPPAPSAATVAAHDWRDGSHWAFTAQPCRHCGGLTNLRDDQKRHAHKVCDEEAIPA